MTTNCALLIDIEKFLLRHQCSASAFGTKIAHDPRFVFELRQGRQPGPKVILRAQGFLAVANQLEAGDPLVWPDITRTRKIRPPLPATDGEEEIGVEAHKEHRSMMRRSSAALLAALRREHPEQCEGGKHVFVDAAHRKSGFRKNMAATARTPQPGFAHWGKLESGMRTIAHGA